MAIRKNERSYRSLLVSLLDETSFEYKSFQQIGGAALGDFLNALKWLKELPSEVCPFVTDDELTPIEDGDPIQDL